MPPGAAFCPAFGGAFTVRFVIFSASSQTSLDGRYAYLSTTVEGYLGRIVVILDLEEPTRPK